MNRRTKFERNSVRCRVSIGGIEFWKYFTVRKYGICEFYISMCKTGFIIGYRKSDFLLCHMSVFFRRSCWIQVHRVPRTRTNFLGWKYYWNNWYTMNIGAEIDLHTIFLTTIHRSVCDTLMVLVTKPFKYHH